MTQVDRQFVEKARDIVDRGYQEADVPGATVRPHWADGTPAYTVYLPQQIITYPAGTVPLTNYRRIAWKTAIRELLWIYKDKSNDVDYLRDHYNVKYWEEWKNEEGTLGTAYGFQTNKKFRSPETKLMTDQVDRLLRELKENPLNRRIFTNLIDLDEMSDMTLVPCAFMTMWTVTENRLNMTLIQRSGDFLAAAGPGCINAFQYYALLRMVAQVSGYEAGDFVHFIQNLHIYDRHIPILEEVLQTDVAQRPTPRLEINPDVKNFYDFTIDDFKVVDYDPDKTKYDIPIAI